MIALLSLLALVVLLVAVARKLWFRTMPRAAAPTATSYDLPDDIDPRLGRRLAGEDRHSLRLLRRHQESLIAALRSGENVRLVVAEEVGRSGVIVVTSRRLLVADKYHGVRSITPARIGGTQLRRRPNGHGMTLVNGTGLTFMLPDLETADLLAVTIDALLAPAAPAAEPRDIPTLLPDYYRRILFATGKPDTPGNTVALMELVTQMLWLNAAMWFDEMDDTAAASEFNARFAHGGADPDRTIHLVDDMIDYLWAWRTNTHQALRDFIHDAEQTLTAPTSQLWRYAAELPMGMWSADD